MLRVKHISPSESLLTATESTKSSSGKRTYSLHPWRPLSLISSRVVLRASRCCNTVLALVLSCSRREQIGCSLVKARRLSESFGIPT